MLVPRRGDGFAAAMVTLLGDLPNLRRAALRVFGDGGSAFLDRFGRRLDAAADDLPRRLRGVAKRFARGLGDARQRLGHVRHGAPLAVREDEPRDRRAGGFSRDRVFTHRRDDARASTRDRAALLLLLPPRATL